jgi:hypothetical protein
MKYKNLHEYLDAHLGMNPSDADIKQAKTEYWKGYRTEHRKKRLQEAKALNLTLPLALWDTIIERSKKAGLDVYDFIKLSLENKIVESSSNQRNSIKKELYECIEMIEEYLDNEPISLFDVIKHIESINSKL